MSRSSARRRSRRVGQAFALVVFRNKLDGVEHAALVKGDIDAETADAGARAPHRFRRRIDGRSGAAELDRAGDRGNRGGRRGRSGAVARTGAGCDHAAPAWRAAGDWKPTKCASIGLGSQMLRELGVGRMIVLANAPQKLSALKAMACRSMAGAGSSREGRPSDFRSPKRTWRAPAAGDLALLRAIADMMQRGAEAAAEEAKRRSIAMFVPGAFEIPAAIALRGEDRRL